MTDLIQKLRDARRGSRQLDAEIYAWREGVEFVSYSTCRHSGRELVKLKQRDMDVRLRLPEVVISRFTTSLDAIIGLIEEKLSDREWSVNRDLENRCFWATVADDNWDDSMKDHIGRSSASAPIALCIALLSALEGES